MSEISAFVKELKLVHSGEDAWQPSLRQALAGITYEQAAARPIENAHNIWEIVSHITGWEDVFRRRFGGQATIEPDEGDFPRPSEPSVKTWTETLEKLESFHEELLDAVAELPDAILDQTIVGKDYSFRFLLRETVKHKVYHAGQISLLKKAFTD
ncbi:MAG: DinB family protein [Pyrinomonadaceae bacterium]